MAQVQPKVPAADHPIRITPARGRVRVLWRGKVVAESARALDLREASYPTVKYIPRADVDMRLFAKTQHHTHCPYKGEASYYTLTIDEASSRDAAWSYEDPFPAVAAIAGHFAFYPDRVDRIEEIEI